MKVPLFCVNCRCNTECEAEPIVESDALYGYSAHCNVCGKDFSTTELAKPIKE